MRILIADNIMDTFFSGILAKKGLLLISFALTPILAWFKSFLEIEFLGFSLGILLFLTLVITVDFITGIKAAKYNGEKITSRKGYRSVDKLVSYFMFICFTALLQGLLAHEGYDWGIWIISNFKIVVFILIFLWEFHSIGENLQKRYGSKPRMFQILDIVTSLVEKKVISKIESEMDKISLDEKIEEELNEIDTDDLITDDDNHVDNI